MRAAVLFDRDNTVTLDREGGYTHDVKDLHLLPGAAEAVAACNAAGVLAVLVTNQAGLARGMFSEDALLTFHAALAIELKLRGARFDAVYYCPFHGEGSVAKWVVADHPDRKPQPGMLRRALLELGIEPSAAVYLGDKDTDVAAAHAAGIAGVRVGHGELLGAVQTALARFVGVRASLSDVATAAKSALRDRAARARAWLFQHALPVWWERGFDRSTQCFHERLALADASPVLLARRVRVQARQTFVYAHAGAVLGWTGPWREAVAAGCKVLIERGLQPTGGTAYALDATTGQVSDTRRDLYDTAFLVFALANAGHALRDPSIVARAEQLFAWACATWQRELGAFQEGELTPCPPYRQNPHMHMLEALLALYEVTGNGSYLRDPALKIVRLFEKRFTNAEYGALCEYFDADWRPVAGPEGRITEPGHQFEWSWLIDKVHKLSGHDAVALARRIHVHGEVYGVERTTQAVFDEVWVEGHVKTASSRLWPHTERIKANVVHYERTGDTNSAHAAVAAFDKLMSYCSVATPGLWYDRIQVDGTFVQEAAPASSFYHIMMGMSELIRVAEK